MFEFNAHVNEIDGVYQIAIDIPISLKYISMYLINLDDTFILIDSGYGMEERSRSFYSALREKLKISVKDIKYCIITHEHTDHAGNMVGLKEENPEIQIMYHEYMHDIVKLSLDPEKFQKFEQKSKEIADKMIKYGLSEEEGSYLANLFSSRPFRVDYVDPDRILHASEERI